MSTSKPTLNPLPAWSEPLCITQSQGYAIYEHCSSISRKNILFLIRLYETGQLKELRPGKVAWIFDGKIVNGMPKEIPKGSAVWAERLSLQLIQTT